MKRILIVEDQGGMRAMLREFVLSIGHEFDEAADGFEALAKLSKNSYDLILTDLKMPKMDGLALLGKIKEDNPDQMVIMMTAHGTVENAVEAMRAGAYDFILKPFSLEEMKVRVLKAFEQNILISDSQLLRESSRRGNFGDVVCNSPGMVAIYELIDKISNSACPVLILGESGTGKEVLARRIHHLSDRHSRPLVSINCASLAESVLESELFGHEKGAFTGATFQKKGKFELAEGGTLFLDEIGELSQRIQVKLLRFLQEKEFERVGGNRTIKVNVRIICATNRDIAAEISRKNFREDLYYRINLIQVELPALRERSCDIPELVQAFLDEHSRSQHKKLLLDSNVMPYLMSHTWRGNVRELKNVIERATLLSGGSVIRKEHLPPDITGAMTVSEEVFSDDSLGLSDRIGQFEKETIRKVMLDEEGNQSRAARALGLKRSSLQYKLKKYGLVDE